MTTNTKNNSIRLRFRHGLDSCSECTTERQALLTSSKASRELIRRGIITSGIKILSAPTSTRLREGSPVPLVAKNWASKRA